MTGPHSGVTDSVSKTHDFITKKITPKSRIIANFKVIHKTLVLEIWKLSHTSDCVIQNILSQEARQKLCSSSYLAENWQSKKVYNLISQYFLFLSLS